ncbi:MAG: tetratricopeptide repeat protein [bacterium]
MRKTVKEESTEVKSEPEEKKDIKEEKSEEVVEKKRNDLSIRQTHFSLGNQAFYNEHDYIKAIEEYKQAVKEETDELIHLKAIYMLGESYAKLGNLKDAIKTFETISKNYQKHYLRDSARRRIQRLTEILSIRK